MNKWIFCLLIVIITTSRICAQNETVLSDKSKHELGFAAGLTSGIGFSYRYNFEKLSIQTTCMPPQLLKGKINQFNGGLVLLYKLVQDQEGSFFMYASSCYSMDNRRIVFRNNPHYSAESDMGLDGFRSAIGVGMEHLLSKRIGVNLMAGYGVDDLNKNILTFISIEGGIYYRFF